jgi:NADPH:quinone reductase-like Zn-dependent oxidoreductase
VKEAFRDRYGSPDVVQLRDAPVPEPGEGEVLVRVVAASVNRADLDGLTPKPGFVRLFMGMRAPRSHRIGGDVAGVIESVGAGVSRFKPGDQVFGDMFLHGNVGFAEYVCAPEKAFEPMPADMSFEEAATLPHSAVLALQALRLRKGRTVKQGDKVLIVGASGNVGPFAIQIAKSMGAEVTGVASAGKMDMVRSLGADHVLDYTKVNLTRTGERYDWIVDMDSYVSIFGVRRALKPNGAYVTLGGGTATILLAVLVGPLMSLFSDKWTGLLLWWKPFHPPDVERLKELIAAGKLKPVIDRRFPLSEVVGALRHVDEGRARGKVVITIESDGNGHPARAAR